MNAFDFLEMCRNKTEEELKDIEIQGFWLVGDLEEKMRLEGIPLDEFTRDEKREILHNVMVDFGDCTTETINNQLDAGVEELHDLKKERKAREEEGEI